MDWRSDPVFQELRNEFIKSFPQRLEKLQALILKLSSTSDDFIATLFECQVLSHSLAGAAETYGFPVLTDLSGKVDDFLSLETKNESVKKVLSFLQLLAEALSKTIQSGVDPVEIKQDPRFLELTSVVQSLLDLTTPESS